MRGLTATTITIGLEYAEGTDEVNSSFGFDNITTGNGRRQAEIMIDEVNRTGGLAGRRILPVFHVHQSASEADVSTKEQAACSTFTEDHEVFAVLSAGAHTDVFASCLRKYGVPFINAPGLTSFDEAVHAREPLFISLNTVALNQQFTLYGSPLERTGYYDANARIGLLTYDLPSFTRAVTSHLLPAVKRIGRSITETAQIAYPERISDASSTSAAVSSAVLRFRQAGITHVLIPDERGFLTVLFTQAASNQGYYPRLGLLAQNAGQTVADGTADKRAFEGAVELGWLPAVELSAANETVSPPGKKRCLELFAAKGYPAPTSRNEELILEMQCDVFFFSQRAAAGLVDSLTPRAFVEAFPATVSDVAPASTYRIDLRSHPAGASAYRVQRWHSGCGCFRAEGGLLPIR